MKKTLQVTAPSDNTRLGRMLHAGRLTVTMQSKASGNHITLTFSSKAKIENKWQSVPFTEATHVFINQGQGGWGSPKIGTLYPKKGDLYLEKGFDTAPWLYAVTHTLLAAANGVTETEQFKLEEAERCGKCGKELTDPVSIERGIGPTCYGSDTGSQHYHKGLETTPAPAEAPSPTPVAPVLPVKLFESRNEVAAEAAIERTDKKGRIVPKTFEDLAAAVRK